MHLPPHPQSITLLVYIGYQTDKALVAPMGTVGVVVKVVVVVDDKIALFVMTVLEVEVGEVAQEVRAVKQEREVGELVDHSLFIEIIQVQELV
jgi:hypothetical protein